MSSKNSEYLKKLGAKVKKYRQLRGMSQTDLAKACGFASRSSINKFETGEADLSRDKFAKVAQVLGVSPVELMDVDGAFKNHAVASSVPVYDSIIDGINIELNNSISAYEDIPQHLTAYAEYFGFRIQDRSMEPFVCLGDIVIVKRQQKAAPGDLVIVSLNSAAASCKKYEFANNCHMFYSYNANFPPVIVPDSASNSFNIIGSVVELRRKFAQI